MLKIDNQALGWIKIQWQDIARGSTHRRVREDSKTDKAVHPVG
jgi:hypothetical protein